MAKGASEKGQAGQALIFYQICAGLGGTIIEGHPSDPINTIANNTRLPNLNLSSIIDNPTTFPSSRPHQTIGETALPVSVPGFTVPTPSPRNLPRVRD